MADATGKNSSAKKAPSAEPAFKKAARRNVRASDWSKRMTYDGKSYDILPPVNIRVVDAVVCKWAPDATAAENIAAHERRTKALRLKLMQAALILSQTAEGRRNLQTLKDLGYKVIFDTGTCKEHKALGLCLFASKQILLSENIDSVARLALVLNHEAAHARLGQTIIPGAAIRLDDQMMVLNVHEAHARASEAKVALEIMVGHPRGPKSQLITSDLIKDIKKRYPLIAKAAIATGASAGTVHDGQAMADAFIAYFAERKIRTRYEERHVGWLGDLQVGVLKNKKTHRQKVDAKKLKAMLKDGNIPYLERHRPNVDLSAPRYSGVSSKHIKAFRKAWHRFMRHAPLNTVFPPQIAVYPPEPKRGFIDTIKKALTKERKLSLPGRKPKP